MPVYEFKCEDCGEEFEKFVISFSRISDVKCPNCQSENIVKKISACGIGGSCASAGCTSFG